MDLQHQRSAAAGRAVRVDHLAELVDRLLDGGQPVGPAADPAGGLDADRRPDQRRWGQRAGPDPGPVDGDQALVADLLAGQQGPDHVHALAEPSVAELLPRPALAGDVLVGRFAGAESDPEPALVHRFEGGDGLGDDRRVVSLAGSVDHPERQAGRLHRRPQPGPGERRVALPRAPGAEVVGAHRRGETGLLGSAYGLQEDRRMDLLVRGMESDNGHGPSKQDQSGAAVLRPIFPELRLRARFSEPHSS